MQGKTQVVKTEEFSVDKSGRYAIQVSAALDGSVDMSLQIDGIVFGEIPPEKNIQRFNIPASWNGTILKGHTQTNIYIT